MRQQHGMDAFCSRDRRAICAAGGGQPDGLATYLYDVLPPPGRGGVLSGMLGGSQMWTRDSLISHISITKGFCASYKHHSSFRFSEALSPSSAKRKSNHPTLIFVRSLSLSIRFIQSLQTYFFPLIVQICHLAPLLKGTFLCTVIDSNCCNFFDAFIKRHWKARQKATIELD